MRQIDEIVTRLTPDQIIERAEARERAWLRWALFWMLTGALCGTAATLLAIALRSKSL
jgi:hypothetical protein